MTPELLKLPGLSPEETVNLFQEWQKKAGIEFYSPPKQIFNISLEEFKSLVEAQVDITALYLLECVSNRIDIIREFPKSSKVLAWYQTLQRKSYVTKDGYITETGKQLLDLVKAGKEIKQELDIVEIKQESDFDKWWAAFPSNDIFTYKGRTFNGSRSLKSDKTKCKIAFDRIMNEGEYTVDDLIRALNYEITLKKEASLKEGVNKLQYLSGSAPYLNQRKFEAFIDDSKEVKFNNNSSSQYSGYDI